MDYIKIIGLIAAMLTTFSFFPQAVKTIRTKDAKSISLVMYSILVVGITLWMVYGILIKDLPVFLANVVTLVPTLIILYIKIKEKLNE
jgi:MtN3 and saliva related transmembrane protein